MLVHYHTFEHVISISETRQDDKGKLNHDLQVCTTLKMVINKQIKQEDYLDQAALKISKFIFQV